MRKPSKNASESRKPSKNASESQTEQQALGCTGSKQEHVGLLNGSISADASIHQEEQSLPHETEHRFDRGGHLFRDLLGKLSRMHESVLQELSVLRAENDALCHNLGVDAPSKLREAGLSQESTLELMPIDPDSPKTAKFDPSERTSANWWPAEVSDQGSDPKATSFEEGGGEAGYPSLHVADDGSSSSVEAVAEKEERWAERPGEPPMLLSLSHSCNGSGTEVVDAGGRSPTAVEIFQARDEWQMSKSSSMHAQRASALTPSSPSFVDDHIHNVELVMRHSGWLRHFISFPASRCRTVWDLFGALLIFWDLAIIPLNNSFLANKESEFVDMMDWVTLIFWTANVPASLLVGFVKNGVTVMIPHKIFIHYLKTWFLLDVVVVVPDWVFTIAKMVGSSSNAGNSVKLLRIVRLARCMRLLRLAKLRFILASINDLINSEYTSIIVNIFKMILSLLACNHFIGCLWFLVSELSTGPTWVNVHNFSEEPWTYQYATAFHWSITQFTPSSMHVQPQNLVERTFAVTVVVFGLVGFSYLVGSITGSLTELRKMNSDMTKQFWNLRRYLNQNRVPTELAVRIQKYLEHQWQMRKVSVLKENVTVLRFLSEQLTHEMQCAIVLPNMLIHPLFEQLNNDSVVTLQRLAHKAIDRKLLAAGDSLFHPLETATHLSFVVTGKLQYIRMAHREVKEWVDKGEDWIAEPVLWTSTWFHHGHLIAAASSDLLLIDAKKFPEIVKRNPHAHFIVSGYAIRYIARLNEMDSANLSDITQGELETEELRELLEDSGVRSQILRQKFGMSKNTLRTRTKRAIQNFAADPLGRLLS